MLYQRFSTVAIGLLSLLSFSAAMASGTTDVVPATYKEKPVALFQVIESQLILNQADIESVTIDPAMNGAVRLKLNPEAAHQLEFLTEANIGKRLNLIVNQKLISSPTIQSMFSGGDMILTGFTESEANAWIQSLN